MTVVPAVNPVTSPLPAPTVATTGSLLVQLPPGTPSVIVIDEPTQTLDAPDIVPAVATGLIVITLVARAVPQLPETE